MRITQIRSPADFGWWCIDQLAHGLIVLAATGWMAAGVGDIAIASVVILTIREGEQGREAVEEWLEARKLGDDASVVDLLDALHLPDRVSDIAGGTVVALAGFVFWLAF